MPANPRLHPGPLCLCCKLLCRDPGRRDNHAVIVKLLLCALPLDHRDVREFAVEAACGIAEDRVIEATAELGKGALCPCDLGVVRKLS